ncbi:MAG: hypothetical protein AAGF59_08150 [Pseudomonadota bacterium]
MIWSITFDPVFPWWMIAALSVIGLALALVGLIARHRGAFLRLLALALIVFAMFDPALQREDREPLSSVAAIVVDRSESQGFGNRTPETDQAVADLTSRLERLGEIDVRVVEAGTRSGQRQDGTALFQTLNTALSDVPPERVAGAILVTDGQVHDVPNDARQLGFSAPLHALITGSENERDRQLVLRRAPRFGLIGTDQPVTLTVRDHGIANAGAVSILVKRDGEHLLQEQARPGETIEIPVPIANAGSNIFEFEAMTLDGELTDINNRVVVSIEGVRENLRVLLVSGEPHAGERTWRNLLKSDAAVDLVHFTILRPPEKQDGTPINELSLIAFPTRELFSIKINEFDLIIFDRYRRRGVLPLLYFDNIARYVRDGGAVLVASGPDYAHASSVFRTPLADILPAEPTGSVFEQPYRAAVSETGIRHPVTRDLPGSESVPPKWSRWFRLVDVFGSDGQVVMEGPEQRPLLILNREGDGRVALMLSDHAWLWARGFEGGGPHVPLLRRLSHWLMKEPDLEEEALRMEARDGRLQVTRQTLTDGTEPIFLKYPDGRSEQITLDETAAGIWSATLDTTDLGIHVVEQGDRRALAHVGPVNPREYTDVRSTQDLLQPIAEATGGSARRIEGSGTPRLAPMRSARSYSGSNWIGLRTTEAYVLRGVDRISLIAGFLGLALLLGVLSLTWYREGR